MTLSDTAIQGKDCPMHADKVSPVDSSSHASQVAKLASKDLNMLTIVKAMMLKMAIMSHIAPFYLTPPLRPLDHWWCHV